MSSLLDLASDLINKTKLASDAKQKLFNLEQIKEIVFHREKSLLSIILPEIFELMLERSIPIRRFLVKLAGDALRSDIAHTPHVLGLFSYLVVDGNDRVLQSIAYELSIFYDKMSIFVATMPSKPDTGQYQHESRTDPRDLWHQLRSLTSVLKETISSHRTDILRIQCIQLCERIILFGLPPSSGSAVKDPRMMRASNAHTVLEIPLYHPFIDRNDVEKEADATLSKMVLWARRGGPQGFPFSSAVTAQLGQSIGVVASERLSVFKIAVPALVFLVEGKNNLCSQMTASSRQQLSVTLLRIIRAAGDVSDPDGLVPRLQGALSALDKLNSAPAPTPMSEPSPSDSRKRKLLPDSTAPPVMIGSQGLLTLESDSSEEDEPEGPQEDWDETGELLDEEEIRSSALAAVDAAESKFVSGSKKIRLEDILEGGAGIGSAQDKTVTAPALSRNSSSGMFEEGCTVLAGDLGAFVSEATTSMRLVSLKAGMDPQPGSKLSAGFQSLGPSCDVYGDLALGSLSKILQTTLLPCSPPVLKSVLNLQLLLRTVLAMSQADLEHQKTSPASAVGYIATVSVTLKPRVTSHRLVGGVRGEVPPINRVPLEVMLPRSVWLYLSHSLQAQEGASGVDKNTQESNLECQAGKRFDRLDLVLTLVREVFACRAAHAEGQLLGLPGSPTPNSVNVKTADEPMEVSEGKADGKFVIDEDEGEDFPVGLYDAMCLVVTSRILQRRALRPYAGRVLRSLPRIPLVCLHLLELLLVTGTRQTASSQAQPGRRRSHGGIDRGVRTAAMELMTSLLLHESCMMDAESFRACLFPLLWLCESDDFATRNAAVNALVGVANKIDRDHEPGQGLSHVRTTIILFALQLAVNAVGIEGYRRRMAERECALHCHNEPFASSWDVFHFLCDIDYNNSLDITVAAGCFDGGILFGRKFTAINTIESDKVTTFSKRHLHLLAQLTLTRPHLLVAFLDLYGTCKMLEGYCLGTEIDSISGSAFGSFVESLPENYGKVVRGVLQTEVLNIIPAVSPSSRDADNWFETLLQCDIQALPMLVLVLDSVLSDTQIPPSEHLVGLVSKYFESLPDSCRDIRLMIPMLGGMSTAAVEAILPRLILELKDDVKGEGSNTKLDYLRKSFSRITRARPPPLSRANLLVSLHRIDNESHDMKLKDLLEAIGLCLSAKDEFKADVIREAVTTLLNDQVPPKALMRTVILSSQNIPEIKKFALITVIPKLIRSKVWKVDPKLKVWDGVVMCIKTMSGHRDSEPTLKAVLGLPFPQLKGILKIAPDVRLFVGRMLRTLAEDELEEVVSGKWAGVDDENTASCKEEKAKLVKSILSPSE